MIRLMQYLIFGHIHKWKIIQKINVLDDDEDIVALKYIMQCEECGNIKAKEL